jgi:ribosomal protein L10
MALTKQQKVELGKQYKKNFADAKNVVIIRQTGI